MPNAGGIPVVVLGGSGYVAGELLRLLSTHGRFRVASVVSSSRDGQPLTSAFPHLRGTVLDGLAFESLESACVGLPAGGPLGILAATPHGETAAPLDALLARAEASGATPRAVDLSADFRFRAAEEFEAVYGRPHGAPGRLPSFVSAVPEHHRGRPPAHAAQPGCFTTAVVLAAYPLLASGRCEDGVFASAITGSSGAGRAPAPPTHHPERRSNLRAYAPLAHRHEAEMRRLLAPALGGRPAEVEFVPHSGPFVRGIHATLRMTLREPAPAAEIAAAIDAFYGESSFVSASTEPPGLTEVVGTNRCRIGVAARGRTLVLTSVLDNLVKGAAGGGVQWMNRLFGLDDAEGLRLPGLGWY